MSDETTAPEEATSIALALPAEVHDPEPKPDMSFEELIKRRDAAAANHAQRLQVKDKAALAPGTSLERWDGRGEIKPIDELSTRVGRGAEGMLNALLCADTLRKFCAQTGIDYVAPEKVVFRCVVTECNMPVKNRGGYCEACAKKQDLDRRALFLAAALQSVNHEGARSWCREDNEIYEAVMNRPSKACSICPPGRPNPACKGCFGSGVTPPGLRVLFNRMPQALRTKEAESIVDGYWSRPFGSLLILGPTESGKSALLSRLALRLLDLASAGELDADQFAFTCGIRRTTALALSEARRKHKLGTEEDPPEIALAKKTSLLILDELGYEDVNFDPRCVLNVLESRYEDGIPKPTLIASGRTLPQLCELYGEANIRRIYQPWGRIINLWQGVTSIAA